jgi:hypothetical protein
VIGATSPVTVPPTTNATAATPRRAAPSVGRRRSAAVNSGTARYGSTASAPNPAYTVPLMSAAAAMDPAASPVTATSANRPTGAAIRWSGAMNAGNAATNSSAIQRSSLTSLVAMRVSAATRASMTMRAVTASGWIRAGTLAEIGT